MEKTEKKPTASTAAAEPLPRKTQLLTTICILAQNVAFVSRIEIEVRLSMNNTS